MPTRKIADLPHVCRDPEHNPPTMRCFDPGVYEHECPSCGKVTYFTVQGYEHEEQHGSRGRKWVQPYDPWLPKPRITWHGNLR